MQKFKNIVNILLVTITLSSRGSDRDNVFLYEKNVYARGRTSCLQDNFSRDYILNSALFTFIIFSLTHLLIMFYADSDPPFLSPSPLICACSTNDFSFTSLSLTSRHISRTSISLHHYRRINWLERICGGKWKTNFSKSRSQPLSTCPSDLWDICVVGFLKNTTDKFLTHLNARRFEKNALIQNVISNFNSQLSTLMVGFFGGKRTEKNWCIRSR